MSNFTLSPLEIEEEFFFSHFNCEALFGLLEVKLKKKCQSLHDCPHVPFNSQTCPH